MTVEKPLNYVVKTKEDKIFDKVCLHIIDGLYRILLALISYRKIFLSS